MIEKGPKTFHDVLCRDQRSRYELPAGGYIERLELVPLTDCPKMDARVHYELLVELRAPDGSSVPLHVELVTRGAVER